MTGGGSGRPLTLREETESAAATLAMVLRIILILVFCGFHLFFLPFEFKRQFVLNVGEQKPIEVGGNIAMVEDSCNGCVSWYPTLTKPVPEPTSSSPSVNLDTELGADESPQRWTRHWKSPFFRVSSRYKYWYFQVGRGSNVTVEIAEGFDNYPIEIQFATADFRQCGMYRDLSPKIINRFQPLKVGSPRTFHFTEDDWGTVVVMVGADRSDRNIVMGKLRLQIDYQYALLDGHVPSVNLKDPHIVANGIPRPLVEGAENGSEDERPQPSPTTWWRRTWWLTAQTPRWDDSLSKGALQVGDTITVTVHCSTNSFLVRLNLIVIEIGLIVRYFQFVMWRYEVDMKKVVQKFG